MKASRFDRIRATILLFFSLYVGSLLLVPGRAQPVAVNAIEVEHRFTSLEITAERIAADVKDLKDQFKYILGCLVILMGNAGVQVVRKPKVKPE